MHTDTLTAPTEAARATITALTKRLRDVPVLMQLDTAPDVVDGVHLGLLHTATNRISQIIVTDSGQITDLHGNERDLDQAVDAFLAADAAENASTSVILLALGAAAHHLIEDGSHTHPEYRRGLIEAMIPVAGLTGDFGDDDRDVADAAITLAAREPIPAYRWTVDDVATLTAAIADLNDLDEVNAEYAQAQVALWAHITSFEYSHAARALRIAP